MFAFSSCTGNENENRTTHNSNNSRLVGEWQLSEVYRQPPGNGWSEAENKFTLSILDYNNFTSNQFQDCSSGQLNVTSNIIELVYSCTGFTANYEHPEGTFRYNYLIVDNKLELSPINFTCYEGCTYRFIKLN